MVVGIWVLSQYLRYLSMVGARATGVRLALAPLVSWLALAPLVISLALAPLLRFGAGSLYFLLFGAFAPWWVYYIKGHWSLGVSRPVWSWFAVGSAFG